jgi:hypothetical protein
LTVFPRASARAKTREKSFAYDPAPLNSTPGRPLGSFTGLKVKRAPSHRSAWRAWGSDAARSARRSESAVETSLLSASPEAAAKRSAPSSSARSRSRPCRRACSSFSSVRSASGVPSGGSEATARARFRRRGGGRRSQDRSICLGTTGERPPNPSVTEDSERVLQRSQLSRHGRAENLGAAVGGFMGRRRRLLAHSHLNQRGGVSEVCYLRGQPGERRSDLRGRV